MEDSLRDIMTTSRQKLTMGLLALILPVFVSPLVHGQDESLKVSQQYIDEIAALRALPRVQSAMDHIVTLEPQHLKDLIELTEIPPPPFMEEARAERFAEMLREAGLTDVRIDEVGNVIGRRPGRAVGRVVAFSAHLDTVFPEGTDVTVRFDDDKMYAPGIGDNSRGLVVLLGVLRAMEHITIKTDLNADVPILVLPPLAWRVSIASDTTAAHRYRRDAFRHWKIGIGRGNTQSRLHSEGFYHRQRALQDRYFRSTLCSRASTDPFDIDSQFRTFDSRCILLLQRLFDSSLQHYVDLVDFTLVAGTYINFCPGLERNRVDRCTSADAADVVTRLLSLRGNRDRILVK